MAKMSYPDLDKKFSRMSRSTAEKMTGTHPPKPKPKAKPKKKK